MSKVVGICAFYRKHQFPSGAYSFTENLLRGLASLRRGLEPPERFDVVVFHGAEGIRWSDDQLILRPLPDPWGRWTAEARAAFFDSRGFDGILFPNSYTPPLVRANRAVTVVHDLQYLHLPEHWPLVKRAWMRACHEVTLRKCAAVVAISDTVRNDILDFYGHRWESRVHTIWNPVSLERFNKPAEQTFTNGRPYILCAAVDRAAKNLATLVRAFAELHKRMPEYCLVLAGQLRSDDPTWRRQTVSLKSKLPSAVDLVNDLGLSRHVVHTGFIPDEQLGALYRGAALFVLPSLFEGFGMPAVEAIALGAPTLVSNLPVLREVTLNRAHYIADPLNDRQMADEIAQVLSLGDAASPPADLQAEIRRRISPEIIAGQYLKVLVGDSEHATQSPAAVDHFVARASRDFTSS